MIYTVPYLIAALLRLLSSMENYQGSIYAIGYTVFLALVFLFRKKIKINPKPLLVNCLISSILLFGSKPILENDQYRYLWEGKVVEAGENPYFKNPSDQSLDFIEFSKRDQVGYNKIASVYPPGALFFYSLFSDLSYDNALLILQILSSILVIILLLILSTQIVFDYRVLWILPFLMKEYVQSVHIDLISFIPFILFITAKRRWLRESLYWLSIWIKWVPLLILPYRFIIALKEKSLRSLAISTIFGGFSLAITFLYYFQLKPGIYNGPYAFSFFWKWNAGLYQFLLSIFSFEHITIKITCLLTFTTFYGFYLLRGKKELDLSILYLFSALFFTAHVYNAWYGIWILIPALKFKNNYLLIYSFSAYTSYLLYDFENLELFCSFLTHIWFILGLKQLINRKQLTKRTVSS